MVDKVREQQQPALRLQRRDRHVRRPGEGRRHRSDQGDPHRAAERRFDRGLMLTTEAMVAEIPEKSLLRLVAATAAAWTTCTKQHRSKAKGHPQGWPFCFGAQFPALSGRRACRTTTRISRRGTSQLALEPWLEKAQWWEPPHSCGGARLSSRAAHVGLDSYPASAAGLRNLPRCKRVGENANFLVQPTFQSRRYDSGQGKPGARAFLLMV